MTIQNTIQHIAAGISSTCANTSDICVGALPHTNGGASTVRSILSIVIGIVAVICVLIIAIGGFRYIFSQGDPQAVTKAKATIVYALIGLVVTIFAQFIVIFVVNAVTS